MDGEFTGASDWDNNTTIHPLGLIATLVLGVSLLLLPRRYSITPMLLMACFVPSAQRLVLMGADFTLLRILVLFAWIRIVSRNELQGLVWNRLDTMIVAWKISGTLIQTLAYGTFSVFVNRCGWMFDGLGMYFFFRCVVREWKDLEYLIRGFIVISFPVALAFCVERVTGRNIFSVLGGVPEMTMIREGRLRCQGAYSHAILAGCFWAGTMSWIVALMNSGKKWLGGAGIAACMVVIVNCSSSTPILAVGAMMLGMLLYYIREQIRIVRWAFLLTLVVLHMVMAQPVWHLLARVNVVGGSTGWHRYKILDATINNFSEWWLMGESNPMGWGVWEMRDPTNQFIVEGLRGGLLTLVCFVVMLGFAFGLVGGALRTCRDDAKRRLLVWSLGTALFVHVCSFFSVFYFGQIMMLVYLTLAMIGSLPSVVSRSSEAKSTMVPSQRILGQWRTGSAR